MGLMRVAEKMTRYGWRVDRSRLEAHRAQALTRIEEYRAKFMETTGLDREALGPAGIGATDKVKHHFRNVLHAPDVTFDKDTKRPQFNSPTLVEWATKDRAQPYAVPAAALYAVRKNCKIVEFCETYLTFSASNSRIHFQFNVCGTQTGRWTSSTRLRVKREDGTRKKYSCNAQQIPKKVPTFDFEDGRGKVALVSSLRDVFLPDEGCVLLRADYDQLELRLIAYVYGVKQLIRALDEGIDIHLLTASACFREHGITIHDNKDDPRVAPVRQAAKQCAYAISYQMSKPDRAGRYPTLYKSLKESFPNMTEGLLAELVKRFFALYPEIQSGQQLVRDRLDTEGFTELSLDGRRLYYPAIPRGYNQALNFPMQGTGGALCDRAVLEIDKLFNWERGQQIRAQVHDEIVAQCRMDDAAMCAEIIEAAMSRPAQIGATFTGIPAAADPGLDWGSCMSYDSFLEKHPGSIPPHS